MQVTIRPIANDWTRDKTPRSRRRRPFRVSYETARRHLEREAEKLGAKVIAIQVDLRERDIRRDGRPRAGAPQPDFPGVIVSFDSKHGPLRYYCDACRSWQDNVRAVGLTLERLRLCDLYGVTSAGEQYRGWLALEATAGGPVEAARRMIDYAIACSVVVPYSPEEVAADFEKAKKLYRTAAKHAHPDSGRGEPVAWEELQSWARTLGVVR